MARQNVKLSLYTLYAGAGIVVIAAVAGMLQRGNMSTPVSYGIVAGLMLMIVSFFSSGIVSGRQMKYGSNILLMVVLFGAILFFVNYLMLRYPNRIDMTRAGLFTLSEQTQQIVRELKEPVHAVAFITPGAQDASGSVEELLRTYARISDKLTLEVVDPYVDPVRARTLKVQELGTIVFLAGEDAKARPAEAPDGRLPGLDSPQEAGPERRIAVTRNDYTEMDYSGAQMGQPPTSRFKGEQAFTSAILKVTGGEKRKLYFLAGHEEADPNSDERAGMGLFRDALESEGFQIEQLHLSRTQRVPEDASVLVVGGPKRPLLPVEAQLVVNYVRGGGKTLLLPNIVGSPSLSEITRPFGLEIGDDVAIDPQSRSLLSPFVTVAASYNFHDITEKMTAYTLFPAARSIQLLDAVPGWKTIPLVQTTEAAWAETNVQAPRFDPGVDKTGPLNLVVIVEGGAVDVPARISPEAEAPEFGFGELTLPTPAAPQQAPEFPAEGAEEAGSGPPDAGAEAPASGEAPATEADEGPEAGAEAPDEAPAGEGGPASPEEAGQIPTPRGGQGGGSTSGEPAPATPAATLRWSDQGRLAIVSTSAAAENGSFLEGGNRDLIMNIVNWLVGQEELISIRAKDTSLPQMTLTSGEIDRVRWIAIFIVPALVLFAGLMVWYQRR
jgi:ABC-type uncharacterized transport system involved in gliding motility auxiliary subunit